MLSEQAHPTSGSHAMIAWQSINLVSLFHVVAVIGVEPIL